MESIDSSRISNKSETVKLDKPEERKYGLVFCHGHTHRAIDPFLLNLAEWFYLDIKPTANPDIIASYDNPNNIKEYLRLTHGKLFDYVLIYHCNISNERFHDSMLTIMLSAKRALNKTGQFIFYNYMNFATHRLMGSRKKAEQITGTNFKSIYDIAYVRDTMNQVDQLNTELEEVTNAKDFSFYRADEMNKLDARLRQLSNRILRTDRESEKLELFDAMYDLQNKSALITDEILRSKKIRELSYRISTLKDKLPIQQICGEDYDELVRQIPLKPNSLLNACISLASVLSFESGYRGFGYLNETYRPAHYRNNLLALTLVFDV
jgi:hypothetical protein